MICLDLIRRRAACAAILLPLTLALAACAGVPPPAAQIPTDAPTAAPTDVPTAPAQATATPSPTDIPPTATPAQEPPTPTTAAPSAALSAGDNLLPAPVYTLVDSGIPGQIARLERDGRTLTMITFEDSPVSDFDVAADAGTIVYVFGDASSDNTQRTLVALDGGGRRELFVGEVSAPRISPDGQTLVARLDNPEPGLIVGQDASPPGVWSFPLSGGRPSLVQSDDSLEGQEPPDGTAWTYTPIGYDRGGQRLLLWAYNLGGPSIPGGELVIMSRSGTAPVRTSTCCEGAAWSVDGSAVTIVGGAPGPDLRYGLYRIDATAGDEKPIIEQLEGGVPLVMGARQLLDGQIYAFYQEVKTDDFNWDYPFTAQMVRVADGKITPLRQDSYKQEEAIWRDDASGALITTRDRMTGDGSRPQLLWLDSSGGPAVETEAFGTMPRWADSVRPLYEGDCTLLPAIAWQSAAKRVFSAGALDLQRRLHANGQDVGSPDGFFGDQTRAALHAFQKSKGIPPNDVLDCATWQALLGRP